MSEYDSKQIVLRVNLRDGRFHADYEDFALEGDSLGIYQTGTYRDGQREGRSEHFYPSGALYDRVSYENDELDGPAEFYYENGQLWEKSTYTAGELDGPADTYYENGQLMRKGTHNMSVQCGEWIEDGETVTYDLCPPGLEDGNWAMREQRPNACARWRPSPVSLQLHAE